MSEVEGGTIIVGNYEIALQLTQTRTLKLSGYIYAGESNEELNARLDAAQDAIDRQAVRVDITNKEAQIASLTANMIQYREHVAALVERKNQADRGGKKLTSQEKQQVDKYDGDMRNFNAQIEGMQAAIKAGKQKINGHLQA